MSTWSDDVASRKLQELVELQNENRVWSKEIRKSKSALVKERLANQVSFDDYRASRDRVNSAAAECTRRTAILLTELTGRKFQTT